jgi:hypothetical protein
MGIDYIIHYDCEPKQALTLEGMMGRLKGRERAQAIIQLYREEGDQRPPSEMGFEMVRRLPDGKEETEIVVVQDLLDAAQELVPWEPYCTNCPANHLGTSFGCVNTINYPISAQGERWLLDQLPDNEHPLIFMLLQSALREMRYAGHSAAQLRARPGVFFASEQAPTRELGHIQIGADQVFEMLFLSGPIQPAHGSMLLQFFGGVSQDLDADVMMQLAQPPSREWIADHIPFQHSVTPGDDGTILTLKEFFRALHIAYTLGVPVLLDV